MDLLVRHLQGGRVSLDACLCLVPHTSAIPMSDSATAKGARSRSEATDGLPHLGLWGVVPEEPGGPSWDRSNVLQALGMKGLCDCPQVISRAARLKTMSRSECSPLERGRHLDARHETV